MQNARDFHALAQVHALGLERQRRTTGGHRLDVTADAEGAARALDEHGAYLVIFLRAARGRDQTFGHLRIKRIAPVRPVHGDGEKTVVEILQDDVAHS